MLFTVWSKHPHRATKELVLHGVGSPDLARLANVFRDVCATEVDDDGLVFDEKSVSAERIKEDAEYEGVRITLTAKLGSAKLALQVDVGFGDAITPEPKTIDFPTLLPLPVPKLRMYPRETVVAEKLHAMVYLGHRRMRASGGRAERDVRASAGRSGARPSMRARRAMFVFSVAGAFLVRVVC